MNQEIITKILEVIAGWKWSEIITCSVSIWMAIVATIALNTWKRQSKAKKKTDFLDELTDNVHKYTSTLMRPSEVVKYIKIGIECYEGLMDKDIRNPEAVAYIRKSGKDDSQRLNEYLENCLQPLSKINSLVAKGQALGFKNYSKCRDSCRMLIWQFERIQALSSIIGSTSLNWKNEEVQNTLSSVLTLDHEEINKHIAEYNISFLCFVNENYEEIF